MRVINVIEIINGTIESVESFGVFEEQLSQDVVDAAEKNFLDKVKENGGNIDEEFLLDEGYFTDKNGYEVTLIWSDI